MRNMGVNVRVNCDELKEIVTQNRDKHRDTFLTAQEVYRKKVIEVLERRLDDARNGRKINTYIDLIEPKDMTREYDQVLSMLQMSVDDELELDQATYAAYVLDQWPWRDQVFAANTAYTDAF